MCAIFGFLDYGKKVSASTLKQLLRALSVAAESRGTDATGISYVNNGNIVTFKKAKPAHKVKLYFSRDITAVIGHTRFTTQGSEKHNYNNHPFEGTTSDHTFALTHNGVLYNDKELRKEKLLPDTAIETDSYIAVQLIEHENIVDSNSIKAMAEAVQGSFVFTILRDDNTLFLVKGDNPITLLHFHELGLYIYASTTAILNAALKAVKLAGRCEEVPVNDGNIVRIDSNGKLSVSTFEEQIASYNAEFDEHYESIKTELEEVTIALANITAAVEKGVLTDAIIERSEALEQRKSEIQAQLAELRRFEPLKLENYLHLIDDYKNMKRNTAEFRTFVQTYIDRVVTYPYHIEIVLDVGFGITDELKETITIRRGDLYALFESRTED